MSFDPFSMSNEKIPASMIALKSQKFDSFTSDPAMASVVALYAVAFHLQ